MSKISTHVLDTALGRPAAKLRVGLAQREADGQFRLLGEAETDADGRLSDLLGTAVLEARTYRLSFETGPYFVETGRAAFYPRVEITFQITAPEEHHHVPLLLSPFGYSTYRGS